MKGSNSKMLQIPLKRQLPAPKCYKFHQNSANAMENERFQLQNVAKTVEMAVSSRKMLQIARKTGRKIDPPQKKTTRKKNKTILDPYLIHLDVSVEVKIIGLPKNYG
jgi:hypothetical protein